MTTPFRNCVRCLTAPPECKKQGVVPQRHAARLGRGVRPGLFSRENGGRGVIGPGKQGPGGGPCGGGGPGPDGPGRKSRSHAGSGVTGGNPGLSDRGGSQPITKVPRPSGRSACTATSATTARR